MFEEVGIILDTETTGTDHEKDQIIEIASIGVGPDLEIFNDTSGRFRPTVPISWGAMATHHIHEGDLIDFPVYQHGAWNLAGVGYIIGHNVDFDWRMLGCPPVRRICTLAIARLLWPNLDSHKLTALMYFLEGVGARERLKSAHQALEDCYFVYDVLDAIRERGLISWQTWEDLWLFSENARLPRIMTFGKYKGAPVQSVDMGYRQWYFKQPDPDPYLLKAWGYNVDIP